MIIANNLQDVNFDSISSHCSYSVRIINDAEIIFYVFHSHT